MTFLRLFRHYRKSGLPFKYALRKAWQSAYR
jgi:hypothetical protein